MRACDSTGPLQVMVAKLYPKDDCTSFDSPAGVMTGTRSMGQNLRLVCEAHSPDD